MTKYLLVFAAIVLSALVRAGADEPATQPTLESAEVLETFRIYNDAMMRLDELTMDRYNHVTNGRERKLANVMLEIDLGVARLKRTANEKFGAGSGDRVGRALGDIGNDELKGAEVKIDGDRAVVTPPGAPGGRRLVKVDGYWKFETGVGEASEAQVDAFIERLGPTIKKNTTLLDDLNAGKFKTLDDLLAAAKQQ